MKIAAAIALCALLAPFAGAASSPREKVDFPAEKSYYIKADNTDILAINLKRFVFNQLDRRTPLFAVSLEAGALKSLSTDAMLNGTDTSLTSGIIEDYIGTEGKDYCASLLADYSSTVQCFYPFWDRQTPYRVMIIYRISWNESLAETEAVYGYARERVTELISPNMSSYERIKALHDFIVATFSYDTSVSESYDKASVSPYSMTRRGEGICGAYSGLMYQLLNAAGYRCRILLKDTFARADDSIDAHAWNLVEIDGVWYHIDATWDDPVSDDGSDYMLHDFFLKSDVHMRRTHSWEKSAYPPAPSSFPLSKAKAGKAPDKVYAPVVDLTAVPADLAGQNDGPPDGIIGILQSFLPYIGTDALILCAAVLAAAAVAAMLLRRISRRRRLRKETRA